MALNLSKTVEEILKTEQGKGYTAKQLAQEIFRVKTKDCFEKMERSKATVIPLNSEEALTD